MNFADSGPLDDREVVLDAGASGWSAVIDQLPDSPAIFAILAAEGAPYLARTTRLRWRLKRLLSETARFSLLSVARQVRYRLTGSRLEGAFEHYQWARRYFPEDWMRRLRLRAPGFVKLIQSNAFPRTQAASRLTGGSARWFGPFRNRASAEAFEQQMLDLFQIRRCSDDLDPSPEHAGCIYGEMALCLRPCQEAVSREQYAAEAARAAEFFRTAGASLRGTIAASRDHASEQMEFELAARQHARLEKVDQVLRLRDELAADLDNLCGVAVLPSATPGSVELQFMAAGWFQPAVAFPLEGAGQSMDARLRRLIPAAAKGSVADRQDHVSLLASWFYSTWRDGEWIAASSLETLSFRKIVNAIARVARTPPDAP